MRVLDRMHFDEVSTTKGACVRRCSTTRQGTVLKVFSCSSLVWPYVVALTQRMPPIDRFELKHSVFGSCGGAFGLHLHTRDAAVDFSVSLDMMHVLLCKK